MIVVDARIGVDRICSSRRTEAKGNDTVKCESNTGVNVVLPWFACRRAIVKRNVSCTSDIKLTNDLETVLAGVARCRAVSVAVVLA